MNVVYNAKPEIENALRAAGWMMMNVVGAAFDRFTVNFGNAFSAEALARDREALRQGQIGRESRAHGMEVVSNKLVEQEGGPLARVSKAIQDAVQQPPAFYQVDVNPQPLPI